MRSGHRIETTVSLRIRGHSKVYFSPTVVQRGRRFKSFNTSFDAQSHLRPRFLLTHGSPTPRCELKLSVSDLSIIPALEEGMKKRKIIPGSLEDGSGGVRNCFMNCLRMATLTVKGDWGKYWL